MIKQTMLRKHSPSKKINQSKEEAVSSKAKFLTTESQVEFNKIAIKSIGVANMKRSDNRLESSVRIKLRNERLS